MFYGQWKASTRHRSWYIILYKLHPLQILAAMVEDKVVYFDKCITIIFMNYNQCSSLLFCLKCTDVKCLFLSFFVCFCFKCCVIWGDFARPLKFRKIHVYLDNIISKSPTGCLAKTNSFEFSQSKFYSNTEFKQDFLFIEKFACLLLFFNPFWEYYYIASVETSLLFKFRSMFRAKCPKTLVFIVS